MKKYDSVMNEIVITLHETPGIGWHTIRKAVRYGDWKSYPKYEPEAWVTLGFHPDQAKSAAEAFRKTDFQRRRERMKQLGITVLTPYDDSYPKLLPEIPQPPWVLYLIGRLDLLQGPSIAIVGTREPTAYGRRAACELSEGLSQGGVTIVSGMAKGIDGAAHEGALRGGGGTIAVLGTPVNVIYPPQHRSLYTQLAEQGLIVSEVPLGMPFHPGNFPLRNRIIAGLSIGTVVVEAAERSGSLITADQALDMSREVFAVPGPISSPKSAGTNRLIREGRAKLVSEPGHIVEEFDWLPLLLEQNRVKSEAASGTEEVNLTQDEAFIYSLLQDQPRTTDELHELSSYPFGLLHAVLINLSIKRKIEQHPGSKYSVT